MIIMMYQDQTHSAGINTVYDNNDDYYIHQVNAPFFTTIQSSFSLPPSFHEYPPRAGNPFVKPH